MNYPFFALIALCGWHAAVHAGALNAVVNDKENNPLSEAVVLATPTLAQTTPRKSPKSIVIDQVDKEFIGHVTVISVDTPVQFPNSDNIRHHVYSFSSTKPFELPLYTGTPAKPVIFDKPGVVKLGCNIHDWMKAYIYVSEMPYFSTTDKDGKAQILNLPAGEYAVWIWHPRMELTEEATKQSILIDNTGETTASWQLALKPELRPRRAPIPIQQDYR
jgi:plastocyanin